MSQEHNNTDPRPSWLINAQAPNTTIGSITVDGKSYDYTTIRADLVPDLPFGVGYPEEHALMISENAPELYIPFVLAHEVREMTVLKDLPEDERCIMALATELEDVQTQMPQHFSTYLKGRQVFFEALVKLYEKPEQLATKTPEFIAGINTARNYLYSIG